MSAERAIASLALRGDLSGLTPEERTKHYVKMCEDLGLNPAAQPFAYLRLNGKEVLYATRGATDQLAAIHKVNREIIDGPKVIDLAGTKMVFASCRATLPSGRFETAVATVALVDPVNVLMRVETKAKRRATLSILGLGLLDETEVDAIPAAARETAPSLRVETPAPSEPPAQPEVPVQACAAPPSEPAITELEPVPEEPAPPREEPEVPEALRVFFARVEAIELPGESVGVWIKHRAELATLPGNFRETAWKALCKKTEQVGKLQHAKVWLKKAIAIEDARRSDEPVAYDAGGAA